jgi:hypothetical protein
MMGAEHKPFGGTRNRKTVPRVPVDSGDGNVSCIPLTWAISLAPARGRHVPIPSNSHSGRFTALSFSCSYEGGWGKDGEPPRKPTANPSSRPLPDRSKNPKKVLALERCIGNVTALQFALARNNPSGGIGRSVPRANVGGGFSNEHSTSTISRLGWAGPGMAGRGRARRGKASQPRDARAVNSATISRPVVAWRGTARRGWAWQVNHERTGREQVQDFAAGHGTERHGRARRGWAGLGKSHTRCAGGQQRNIFAARLRAARHGGAWQGTAGHGKATTRHAGGNSVTLL